jgi:hypothetical protein
MRALILGGVGLLLQVLALTPFVEDLSADVPAAHYLQHGIIFLGGLLMGFALRDLWMMSRRADRG